MPVPSWACLWTGHELPATGPQPPPEPVGAKPPARHRPGRAQASHCRAATPPKVSPAGTRPGRVKAATASRDHFGTHGAIPVARTPPARPAGIRSELENLRVRRLRDRLSKRLQIFGASRDRMQHESPPRPVTTAPATIKPIYRRDWRGSSKPRLVSVLVSFTPVRHRSPVVALVVFAQATDAGGRW